MNVAQRKVALEIKKLSIQINKSALRKRLLGHIMSNNNTQNALTNGSTTETNNSSARQNTTG